MDALPQQPRFPLARDADRLREQLVVLAVECPCTKSNPFNCPLHEVRKLEPSAIIDWLDGLNHEEQDYLALYHECCLVTQWEKDWQDNADRAPARRWSTSSRDGPR